LGNQIQLVTRGDVLIARLSGRIHGAYADEVDFLLSRASRNISHLLMDLRELEFVGATGLRTLLRLTKELERRDGGLVVMNVQNGIRDILEVADLIPMIPVVEREEEAFRHWGFAEGELPPPREIELS
jgi:anti-anti-sigma factor